MKRLTLLVLVMALLAGCSSRNVESVHLQVANEYCADNGGLDYISHASRGAKFDGRQILKVTFTCANCATFRKQWSERAK